jgi:hypothetical protein
MHGFDDEMHVAFALTGGAEMVNRSSVPPSPKTPTFPFARRRQGSTCWRVADVADPRAVLTFA